MDTQPNPVVRILLFLVTALALPRWSGPTLVLAATIFILVAWLTVPREWLVLMRRVRWLLLSIALIYAFATPGEYLAGFPENWAPTYEGLRTGCEQLLRLVGMLASLCLLLGRTPRDQLTAGIRFLALPLRYLGLDIERFAVRLWLTLHYVEHFPPGMIHQFQLAGWNPAVLGMSTEAPVRIDLPVLRWRARDFIVLGAVFVLAWQVVW